MTDSKPESSLAEYHRLHETKTGKVHWKQWGPYLAERAWGTVREDYSSNGNAWDYFPHDHARSRVYRWNEDGLAGISYDQQNLCFLWHYGTDRTAFSRSVCLDYPVPKEIMVRMSRSITFTWMPHLHIPI